MVYDENNNPIRKAEISVAGINHDVTSGKKIYIFQSRMDEVLLRGGMESVGKNIYWPEKGCLFY